MGYVCGILTPPLFKHINNLAIPQICKPYTRNILHRSPAAASSPIGWLGLVCFGFWNKLPHPTSPPGSPPPPPPPPVPASPATRSELRPLKLQACAGVPSPPLDSKRGSRSPSLRSGQRTAPVPCAGWPKACLWARGPWFGLHTSAAKPRATCISHGHHVQRLGHSLRELLRRAYANPSFAPVSLPRRGATIFPCLFKHRLRQRQYANEAAKSPSNFATATSAQEHELRGVGRCSWVRSHPSGARKL